MALRRGRAHAYRDALVRLLARGPKRPSDLTGRAWFGVIRRTVSEFIDDELNDRAASLTYYGILSIFPGLIVLVAFLGLLGPTATTSVMANISTLAPGPSRDFLANWVEHLREHQGAAGIVALAGVVIASYSATSYVGGFMRAANAIYDVPEGRPLWKTLPIQLAVTAVTGLFLAVSAVSVFLTGGVAHAVGHMLGLEQQTVRIFDIVKWPVLVVAASMLINLLYWAAPNARQSFRWITPGSFLAVAVWAVVSVGFAVYIALFATYDRTYGALGGVIIFLVWLWLTNVAILLGAEFDAEIGRARAIAAGLPPTAEPYVPMRDVPRREAPERTTELREPAAAPTSSAPPAVAEPGSDGAPA